MHLYADTEFGKAVKKLFARLNQIALVDGIDYEDDRFKAYIFGGAAVQSIPIAGRPMMLMSSFLHICLLSKRKT